MRFEDDTIAAISTPVGQGGIGIVRLSGPRALRIADGVFRPAKADGGLSDAASHGMLYGHIAAPDGFVVDEVLVSVMRGPYSYTKEDIVEVNCHGGVVSVTRVLELLISQGARLAEPGEFTKRAFLNGRIGLVQAEAVLDLITARTGESMRIAVEQLKGGLSDSLSRLADALTEVCAFVEACIDFPEEGIEPKTSREIVMKLTGIKEEVGRLVKTYEEARFFREGLSVAIVGRPNVGKSSLLNALLKKDRAIVTEFPGTTRDLIEDYLNIDGLPVRIIDTAGIRNTGEEIEKEGVKRSIETIRDADFIIAMVDGSEPLTDEDHEILERIRNKNNVIAVNKADLPRKVTLQDTGGHSLRISAISGEGLDALKAAIFGANLKNWKEDRESIVVTNMRHKLALEYAAAALERAVFILEADKPLEILSIELREALDRIGEITGVITTEDILDKIFSDFCIGK